MPRFFYKRHKYILHAPKKVTTKNIFLYRLKKTTLFTFVFIIIVTFLIIIQFQKRVLPTIIEIAEHKAATIANQAIDASVSGVINEMNLTSSDFFQRTHDEKKEASYLNVDTLLINNICSKLAVKISEELNLIDDTFIKIPSGVFMGSGILSNYGPKINFSVLPMGNANVDYDTSFQSVGINQINFQVWLNVQCSLRVVNPLQSSDVGINRKIMLVNTVFNGEVPETYLQLPASGSYKN